MQNTFIKKDEMDQITESVLRKSRISTEWAGIVERIDIDSIIEFDYGLEIVWDDITHLSRDGDVLAAIFPKHKKIYMNDSMKELFLTNIGMRNFTEAHELGHWVLHVVKNQDYQQLSFSESDLFICRGGPKRPMVEIQADMFAASILMPKAIIAGAINQIKETRQVVFPDLYKLRDQFEVSISALVNRVNQLGILYAVDNKVYSSKAEATGQLVLF